MMRFVLLLCLLVSSGCSVYFQKFFGNAKNEYYSCSSLPVPSKDRGLAVIFGQNTEKGSLVAVHSGESLHFCLEFPVVLPRALLIDNDRVFMFFSSPVPPLYGSLSGFLKGGWVEYPWKNKTSPSRAHAWILARLSLNGDILASTYLTTNDRAFGMAPMFLNSATFSEDSQHIIIHISSFGNAFPSKRDCMGPAPFGHSLRLPLNLSQAEVCEDLACLADPTTERCNFTGKPFRETVLKPASSPNLLAGVTLCVIVVITLILALKP